MNALKNDTQVTDLAKALDAQQPVAWRWPEGNWQDGEPDERNRLLAEHCESTLELAYAAPQAPPAAVDGWGPSYPQPWAAREMQAPPAARLEECPACQKNWGEHRPGYSASACKQAPPAAVPASNPWRPIETAPTDGTTFLVYLPKEKRNPVQTAWQNQNGVMVIGSSFSFDLSTPTLWMPLDPMLAAAERKEGE